MAAERGRPARAAPTRALSRLWARLSRWLRSLLVVGRRPLAGLLPGRAEPAWGEGVDALPEDVREELGELRTARAALCDVVARAIADYAHLRRVLLGGSGRAPAPGAGAEAAEIDEANTVAAAEIALRAIVARARALAPAIGVAAERGGDRAGREVAGAELVDLREAARELSEAASEAVRFRATGLPADADALWARGHRLEGVARRADGA